MSSRPVLRRVPMEGELVEETEVMSTTRERVPRRRYGFSRLTRQQNIALLVGIIVAIIIIIIIIVIAAFLIWYFAIRRRGGGARCSTTSNCRPGFVCDNGRCRAAPLTPCQIDQDCASNSICVSGFCRGTGTAPCSDNNDCASSFVCSMGSCRGTENASCNSNEDCLSPLDCIGGTCEFKTCITSADCSGNEFCDTNGNCVLDFGELCTEDIQCNGGDSTRPVTCSNTFGRCGAKAGQACLVTTPMTCSSGICNETIFPAGICGCADNGDCASGLTCNNGNCS